MDNQAETQPVEAVESTNITDKNEAEKTAGSCRNCGEQPFSINGPGGMGTQSLPISAGL